MKNSPYVKLFSLTHLKNSNSQTSKTNGSNTLAEFDTTVVFS